MDAGELVKGSIAEDCEFGTIVRLVAWTWDGLDAAVEAVSGPATEFVGRLEGRRVDPLVTGLGWPARD